MIQEIAANQLLQEELAKHDPNLACVASFLSRVCGTGEETQKLQDAAQLAIQKGVTQDVVEGVTEEVTKEGLPTLAIVAAAADVEAGMIANVERNDPTVPPTTVAVLDAPTTIAINRTARAVFQSPAVETDGVATTVMSVGGSSSDGAQSPSTCGSSVSATGTCKRFADESPERGQEEQSRRKFPGRVTRSASECRVYLPPVGDGEDECSGRILNEDWTIRTKITINQECEPLSGNQVEAVAGARASAGEILILDGVSGEAANPITSSKFAPVPSSFPFTLTPDPLDAQTVGTHRRVDTFPNSDFTFLTDVFPDAPDRVAIVPVVESTLILKPEPVRIIVLVDEWGRDTCVINEICELLESMPQTMERVSGIRGRFRSVSQH